MSLTPEEKVVESHLMPWRFWFLVVLSVLLFITFVYYLPLRFLNNTTSSSRAVPQFQMNVFTPEPLLAGVPQELVLELLDEKGMPLTGLAISHERLVHVVIIRDDFKSFAHIHPEDFGPVTEEMKTQARFPVQYTFPEAGHEYLIAVDGVHQGHGVVLQKRVRTAGDAVFADITKDLRTTKEFDGYSVSLSASPSPPRSGETATLRYRIEKDGLPVANLEKFLAAPMHLAITTPDLGVFMHTHGEIHDPNTGVLVANPTRFGPDVEAHLAFPYPGLYQVFGQFSHEGKVIATSFLIEVTLGQGFGSSMPAHAH